MQVETTSDKLTSQNRAQPKTKSKESWNKICNKLFVIYKLRGLKRLIPTVLGFNNEINRSFTGI